MKELDSSFHIIRHFRHNDKPLGCLNMKRTSERMISLQQAMQARAETGVTRENSRGFTCCKNGVLASSYDIVTNDMCIYLSEL